MKNLSGIIVVFVFCQFNLPEPSYAAAGEQDINAQKFSAKVARVKAKQRAMARKNGTEGEPSGCGGVDIGNVSSESRTGNVDNVVVVEGDIINIANNCKKD